MSTINELKTMLDQKLESLLTQKREEVAQQTLAPQMESAPRQSTDESVVDEEFTDEEIEQIVEDLVALDEISKETLGAYVNKAARSAVSSGERAGRDSENQKSDDAVDGYMKASKRLNGIRKAVKKLTKESADHILDVLSQLEEANLTYPKVPVNDDLPQDKEKKERIRLELIAGRITKSGPQLTTKTSTIVDSTTPNQNGVDEGKIDDLKDRLAAKALEDEYNTSSTKSVANKNAAKPSRIVVKGSKYGGSKQKADLDNELDIETK